MTNEEMKARYKQAELLYVMKECEDALEILEELLHAAPGNRDLMIAKIKCLTAMGFREEAKHLCRTILSSHEDAHAASLLARLENSEQYSNA
ncbi:MAG: tetratricopeptide repeat protein [Candidatus Hydrogenedentes bacterium]|jgi:thioredoxin-like negative regulator of GroEL|nr:tetratricopeptide repeat protein [Candidatus Hydrogenedentota bacterium]